MLQLPSIWAEYALFFKCACTRPPPGGFGPIYRIVSQLAQQGFIEKGLKQRPQASQPSFIALEEHARWSQPGSGRILISR